MPGPPPPQSSTEKTARLVAAVISALALIGVLLVAVITSDDPNQLTAGGRGTQSDTGNQGSLSTDGGDESSSGSSSGSSNSGPETLSPSAGTSSPTDFPSQTPVAPSSSAGSSASSTTPSAAALRSTFPTPPGTRRIPNYAGLTPKSDELWYLSTSKLETVNAYYVKTYKTSGWITYVSPNIYRDKDRRPTGYFYIYHLDSKVTSDLSMDANYLGKKPGQTLIRVSISDD